MAEYPIIFSPMMVKSIIDGKKTQTRRVIKNVWEVMPEKLGGPVSAFRFKYDKDSKTYGNPVKIKSPYGYKNDLLWVKERFCIGMVNEKDCLDRPGILFYENLVRNNISIEGIKWKPSIFMFKKYARIWLKNKGVRVERLQDITEQDAIAEGVENNTLNGEPIKGEYLKYPFSKYENDFPAFSAVESFKTLWDSINGKPRKNGADISWNANPWVWVTEFEKYNLEG